MKKLIAALVVLAFCIVPGMALADFQGKVHQEVRKEIGAFFERNVGNKITIDVMDGLMLHLNQIFETNIILPPETPALPPAEKEDPKPQE